MKILKTVLFLIMMGFSMTVAAQEHVVTFQSEPGESYGSFVKRTALFMDKWTTASNNEICGLFARKGNSYSIQLWTLNAQTACRGTKISEGYEYAGQHIHSHPVGQMRITNTTRVHDKSLQDRRYVRMTLPDDKFSDHDLTLPGGYIVTNGKMMWQNGPQDIEHLGPIDKL